MNPNALVIPRLLIQRHQQEGSWISPEVKSPLRTATDTSSLDHPPTQTEKGLRRSKTSKLNVSLVVELTVDSSTPVNTRSIHSSTTHKVTGVCW
ncbi:unnamed protein product [Pleuronectes platessa]|uniref:Uncharacterized protein n=1 Tax=Pleuronectes platessa TaxID=8262 RepID=A0A9N7Y9T6_PLEPL|nr:unnamed protein product [Pleuronectes platessa]